MKNLSLNKLVVCLMAILPMMANAYEPSVTAQGMGGIYTSGWADGLMPLYMNNQQMIYSDLQFEGNSTNAGILSAGGGYRQQINSEGILGGYLFYDRERSASENYYNVISPGVEYLTPSWQYRLNYYAPVGTKTHLISQGWAEDFGNTQFIERSGHDSFDRWQYNYESLSYGADATVGYRFQTDKRWQVNLSPYVFNQTENNTMMGANAQLNFYSNDHTTVFIGDGYDNANHNRVFVGVSFTFGGHNNDDTVDNLMQSPIYRNLDVNSTSNGLPVNDYANFGAQEQSADNLWYVNNTPPTAYGAPYEGDGTYENPYTTIYAVSEMPDNADIRVASTGISYDSPPGDGFGSPPEITLTGTQTMAGYTNDYNTLATGNDRPTIITGSGIALEGDNTIAALQIQGTGQTNSVGVTVNGAATINDVVIGSTSVEQGYRIGVQVSDGASATINNSALNAATTSATQSPIGLYLLNAGDVTVNNSTIYSSGSSNGAVGVYISGEVGDVTINDSSVTASGGGTGTDVGIYNVNSVSGSNVSISGSTIDASSTGGTVYGVASQSNAGNTAITTSFITAETAAHNALSAVGVASQSNTGSTSVTDSYITVTAPILASAYGTNGTPLTHTGNTYDINGVVTTD